MLHIEILSIDPGFASALRGRLADRGHAVRLTTPRPESARRRRAMEVPEHADLLLVATGQRPLVRTNVDDLTRLVLPHGRAAVDAPLVLCAALDPTTDAVEALHERGFDVILGPSHQRDIERHVEALERLVQRVRRVARPDGVPPHSGAVRPLDPALATARNCEALAQRRATRSWWSLASLDPRDLRAHVVRLAPAPAPVLVRGERHVGRRHTARVLHTLAGREGSFVEVGADRLAGELEELEARLATLCEAARSGTLCLTNLVGLREDRARLVRAALGRHHDVRLVVTAPPETRPPLGLSFEGAVLDMPPLRDRPEAFEPLARRLADLEVAADALGAMQAYRWPLNIDELDAALQRALPRCRDGLLTLRDLPPAVTAAHSPKDELVPKGKVPVPRRHEWQITDQDPIEYRVYEHKLLLRALAATGGNRTQAAKLVGLGKSTFYRKLNGRG